MGSVCWSIVILKNKIVVEVPTNKWQHCSFHYVSVLLLVEVTIQNHKWAFFPCMESPPHSDASITSLYSGQYTGFVVKLFHPPVDSDAAIFSEHFKSGLITEDDMVLVLRLQMQMVPGPLQASLAMTLT